MPFWDFIRDIFGPRNFQDHSRNGIFDREDDVFRNSVWHNDENNSNMRIFDHENDPFSNSLWKNDENNSIISSFFRNDDHMNIFENPINFQRYFELQVNHIFKNFIFGPNNGSGFMDTFTHQPEQNLRQKMLKPSPGFEQPTQKLDTDLDGKVDPSNFANIWDKQSKPKVEGCRPFPRMSSKSIVEQYVRRPDGTVEQKRVIRDHEGNEETIVSHEADGKRYTVVTKTDKNGVTTKTENFVNIDKNDPPDGKDMLLKPGGLNSDGDLLTLLWRNFNLNPKL